MIPKSYSQNNMTIASIGSHSALDVARGAKDEGFKTLVITQKGMGLRSYVSIFMILLFLSPGGPPAKTPFTKT
jgi:5-formaminoimidazole-4-carboxamide-1-beta-D-ribofuranosyl 5'-monophosphate synthetase